MLSGKKDENQQVRTDKELLKIVFLSREVIIERSRAQQGHGTMRQIDIHNSRQRNARPSCSTAVPVPAPAARVGGPIRIQYCNKNKTSAAKLAIPSLTPKNRLAPPAQ